MKKENGSHHNIPATKTLKKISKHSLEEERDSELFADFRFSQGIFESNPHEKQGMSILSPSE